MLRTLTLLLSVILGGLVYYTTRIAPRWLRVSRLTVRLPGLRPDWEGIRVAHLTDFHLGAPGISTDHLHNAKSMALAFQPDLVALTGDFYDGGHRVSSEGLFGCWPENVRAFAVMGNHDRRGPSGNLTITRRELGDAGVTVLDNEAVSVSLRDSKAWIAGVDDPHTFNSDVEQALSNIPDGQAALVFLSHAPTVIQELRPGQASLLLAGHTHGGQIRLLPSGAVPFVGVLRKLLGAPGRPDGPVHRRWHWINGTVVLISDGLGVSSLPVRFRTRPHVILIELRQALQHSDEGCDDVRRYVHDDSHEHWLLRWLT